MASDEHSLRALEALMSEFFNMITSNERKRQIEELLNNFSQQKDSWKHCLYYLSNTNNEYVMMYCCTVIESLINKQWIGFRGEDKTFVRSVIGEYLLSHHKQVPNFIRNKLCKLIVDIGRLDWPHFFPDFLSNTLKLLMQNDKINLGLMLLQTTSEELACPRDDLSTARKDELHRLLLEHVPNILSILAGILDTALEKSRHVVTATPPPSPTQPYDEQDIDAHQTLFSTSPLHQGSLLSSMFKSLNNKSPFRMCSPSLSSECQESCAMALTCLQHFFSWIPLSDYITPYLLTTIFHFASFGCHPSENNLIPTSHVSKVQHLTRNHSYLGILAMGCINEIMSKNCVPTDFEDFLLQMFQYTFHLLQCLTKDNSAGHIDSSSSSQNSNLLSQLDEIYVNKFTEFLRLFVGVHFRRFESNSQFPVLEFLALLFKYTFQQPSNDGLFNCLDIWAIFLDYLFTKLQNRSINSDEFLEKYKGALSSLVMQVTRKYQFKCNHSYLEELDDDSFDDNNETEWQHFLRQCIEMTAHVADILPLQTFNLIEPLFQENSNAYFSLGSCLCSGASTSNFVNLNDESECHRLHCTLRDLSSILQTVGRFSNYFIGEIFWQRFTTAQLTVKRLCDTVIFSNKIQEFYTASSIPAALVSDFVEVHAQALAALKAFTHWLAQYYLESLKQSQHKEDITSVLRSVVKATVAVINKNVPSKISHSSAHLLLSITSTVRPISMITYPYVENLFFVENFQTLNIETQFLVYRSVSNILLLPWPNTSDNEQQWQARCVEHNKFIKSLTSKFNGLLNISGFIDDKNSQEQAKPMVKWTLKVLRNMVECHVNSVTRTKQLCYQSLQESINITLQLFSIYIHYTDVTEEILSFFLELFHVLQVQMGVPFAEQVIRTFMDIFTRDKLMHNILQEDSAGTKVVEKFLKLLQFTVREPSSAFRNFLPNTIKLCMHQIYPSVAESTSPDVKLSLFELLHNVLLYNWKYFFKSSVMSNLGQAGNESVNNQDEFISIMQAFGQSFLQPDINIFKHNLEALEELNAKWKLYHKRLFKEVMLMQFLKVFIQVLVIKSHGLLQDEIVITVCNMASIDFDSFYHRFIPHVLSECDGINDDQRRTLAKNLKPVTDLPSFTQNIARFVSDLRYYQLCNSSLPTGSVTF